MGDGPREPFNDMHTTMVSGWKRTALENMAASFRGAAFAVPQISEKEVEKLHAKTSPSAIERDFLSASSRLIL